MGAQNEKAELEIQAERHIKDAGMEAGRAAIESGPGSTTVLNLRREIEDYQNKLREQRENHRQECNRWESENGQLKNNIVRYEKENRDLNTKLERIESEMNRLNSLVENKDKEIRKSNQERKQLAIVTKKKLETGRAKTKLLLTRYAELAVQKEQALRIAETNKRKYELNLLQVQKVLRDTGETLPPDALRDVGDL